MKTAIKIICLILIMSLVGPISTPHAQVEIQSYERAANTLVGLNILEGYEDGSLGLDRVIKRSEFVAIITRILGIETTGGETQFTDVPASHWAAGSIEACRAMGIVSGHSSTIFGPEEPLSYSQAVKVLVALLGYDIHAESVGGYPLGYIITANQQGLNKNAAGEADDILRRGIVVQLIYNALHTESAETVGYGSEDIRVITSGKTLLNSRLNINTGRGILEETSLTGLTKVGSLPRGQVIIGDKTFDASQINANEFLGYDVTYYTKKDDEKAHDSIVYIEPMEKNTTETIKADDILNTESAFTKQNFVYEGKKGERVSRRISPYADLIYNGVSVGGFKVNDMYPDFGHVTLLDNNSDGVYDVIFVTEYETFAVASIGGENTTVYDLYDKSKSADLTPMYQESELTAIKDGREAQIAEIQNNNILSIAKSRNTQGIVAIEVVISDKAVSGVLSEKSSDNQVIIGEESYKIANNLIATSDELKIGMMAKFYLSHDGSIAAFEGQGAGRDGLEYGYLIAAKAESGILNRCMFKVLTARGTIELFTGASKVKIDGDDISNPNEMISRMEYEWRKLASDPITMEIEQLVRYKTNSNDEVIEIDTVNVGDNEGQNGIRQEWPAVLRRYFTTSNSFGTNMPEFIIGGETIVFMIPGDDNRGEDKRYSVTASSYFKSASYYTVSAYDLTDEMVARVVLVLPDGDSSSGIEDKTPISIVTQVSNAITPEGEPIRKITVLQNGSLVTYFDSDDNVLENVIVGEFLRIGPDADGNASRIEPVLNPFTEDPKIIGLGTNLTHYFSTWRVLYGMLMNKEGDSLIMTKDADKIADGNYGKAPYKLTQSTRVTIYKDKTQSFSNGTVADIENYVYDRNPNARVVVITSNSALVDVVLMDFND